MSEDLQSLLEKINREGVEKADAEAARIIADAKAKAAAIVKEANESAAAAKASAERASADYAERAKETVSQAARDTVLKVKDAVTALLERLLLKDVETALADGDTATKLAAAAVEDLAGGVEIAAGGKLAAALKARLAANPEFKVVLDPALESGFTVRLDGGRVEHAFTPEMIASELAKRLRPDLAALLG